MKTYAEIDKCQAFLDAQLLSGLAPIPQPDVVALRAVTFSRQAGCGAFVVAERVARLLQARAKSTVVPWTVFDRNLIEQVLQDHHLPVRLAQFMPEDRLSAIQDAMGELFGLHPSAWTVVEHTAETILRLTHLGNVLLIGRGANLITARVPGVFHVRLVAPLADRLERIQRFYNLREAEAREFIDRADKGRQRYLKKFFQADVDDPLLYHLVINTSQIPFDAAAELIVSAALAVTRGSGVVKPRPALLNA